MKEDEKFIELMDKVHNRVKQMDDVFREDYTSVIFASLVTFACKTNIKFFLLDQTKEDIDKMMKEIFKDENLTKTPS